MTPKKDQKTKNLRYRKKERTKQNILTAAEKLFSKRSFEEVSLEEIAESAFVSRTTLYNYFQNKDAIYFEIGRQMFETTNDRIEQNYPNDIPGIDQFLQLAKSAFISGVEKGIIFDIMREFFKRVQLHNVTIKKWYDIIDAGTEKKEFKKLLKNFEEPYLIELYVQLKRNTDLWMKVIRKGKSDGTIRKDLDDVHIAQFVYMLMSGMADEVKLRSAVLDRIGFTQEEITEHIMNLIEAFLKGK
ncbi:MAG: TetR family transcriptional regulator [Candidatus Lokiarchaeota archaeon]|nr:TetR family transcriptional regulator [Candidatus Lokiarchaeota archaeon]